MTASQNSEPTRFGRFLERLFGETRLDRFDAWLAKHGEPEGENRCPWRTALGGSQCIRKVGHGGLCETQFQRTNIRNGYTWTDYRSWYGINYSSREQK